MKLTLIILLALCSATAFSAVPQLINYQGFLTDTDGAPLDTVVSMTFKLYDAGGTPLWTETQPACTVRAGVFTALLGSVVAVPDSFRGANRWLGVTVGDNSEMVPRTRLVSVPYAYRVGTVDGASGGTISGKLNVGSGNLNPGTMAFVAGQNNRARGDYSVVAGGGAPDPADSNSARANWSFIGGGVRNTSSGWYSAIGGGYGNRAESDVAFVGAGESNQAQAAYSAVCGGKQNVASNQYASVGGGQSNTASDAWATVSGGELNTASGVGSAIGGGIVNTASSGVTAVGGGIYNVAANYASTVGGGQYNRARGEYSVVAGGGGATEADSNSASGASSVIGGGYHNAATNFAATIAGGYYHTASGNSATVSGGYRNTATNFYATVGGGTYNDATGLYATIPGGAYNVAAGNYSFAAGRRAKARGLGQFVWADATNADFDISADSINSFNARASGGFKLYTNTAATNGVTLWANDNTWNSVCDSTRKTNIRRVDTRDILDRVSRLPISRWTFKEGNPKIEHISPMAQDFWNLFRIGADSLSISSVDPSGIALAAIQELHHQNQELQKELTALRARLQTLEAAQQQSLNERSDHE